MINNSIITPDELKYRLDSAAAEGYEFRKRRDPEMTENHSLYRDKVITNRLTQRQSVNIPVMKEIVKTILSKIDDFVDLNFTHLGNDKQAELLFNAYWNDIVVVDNKMRLKDMADKKMNLLYGRSVEKWNIRNGKIKLEIIHPQDILIDRYLDPTDIDSARYIIQDNIYSTLSDLKLNNNYDKSVIDELEEFFMSDAGLIKAVDNSQKMTDRAEAMKELGVQDADNPQIGQTIVQMQECFIKVWDPTIEDEQIIFAVRAEGKILYAEFLETVIGKTADNYWRDHFPFGSWAEDLEMEDFWSDGVADIVRIPNKVVNAWYSQMVENRHLRNFGMNYYDSTFGGNEDGEFIPETIEPEAFKWVPFPGDPNKLIRRVEIPELVGNLEEINFVIGVAEKGSAATAITQGVTEQRKITLGEVELLADNAMDRIQSMSLYYKENWLNLGRKYVKLVEALGSDLDMVRISKKGYRGNVFSEMVGPNDWQSELGWGIEVTSKRDKSQSDLDQIQKLNAVVQIIPGNNALKNIYQEMLLEIALTGSPDKIKLVMDEEKQKQDQANKAQNQLDAGGGMGVDLTNGGQGANNNVAIPAKINNSPVATA